VTTRTEEGHPGGGRTQAQRHRVERLGTGELRGGGEAALTCGPRATVLIVMKFDSSSNLNQIQIIFKFVQTLTTPKRAFPSSNFLK
jgi:hypothetical protein